MNITPELIREKRKDCRMELVIKVDLIMEPFVNELVYSGNVIVKHKNIAKHGIFIDDFITELRGRGFLTEEIPGYEICRDWDGGSVKVTLTPGE